jgi:general secretion pathway protein D
VPAQVESPVGGTITLSFVLENAADLSAAPMQIKFDPKVLRMTDVVKGDLMGIDGQQVIYTKNILNDSGTATINLNRMPGTGGVNGSGRLVTMTFQAVGRGVATVSVPQFTARSSQGQPLVTGSPLAMITVK